MSFPRSNAPALERLCDAPASLLKKNVFYQGTKGATMCYGVVTTGEFWQFSQLEAGKIFTRDPIKLSAIENLQNVLNTLNWLFEKANMQI